MFFCSNFSVIVPMLLQVEAGSTDVQAGVAAVDVGEVIGLVTIVEKSATFQGN